MAQTCVLPNWNPTTKVFYTSYTGDTNKRKKIDPTIEFRIDRAVKQRS